MFLSSSKQKEYKQIVEEALKASIETIGEKSKLRDACEYALLNGGKRFRPILVLMIAEALGQWNCAMPAALAVEYFHTASLIADDLPCMDNDDERRNKPTTHKVYGETTALLASYALIAAGYAAIAQSARLCPNNGDLLCRLAIENATYNTGLYGATGGQYLDIVPGDLSLARIREAIHKKTVSLFEISFVFGWLFGGGDLSKLDRVKQAASHFGMAFQIADDIDDLDQDAKNGRLVNMAALFGVEEAKKMFHVELRSFESLLQELNLPTTTFSTSTLGTL